MYIRRFNGDKKNFMTMVLQITIGVGLNELIQFSCCESCPLPTGNERWDSVGERFDMVEIKDVL